MVQIGPMVRSKPKPRKKPKGWVKDPVRHGLAAKGIKTVTKMPIRMNPKLVPMWNAIEDIDTVREALKKDNLFFRSLVDAKVELQRAVDNTAIGHVASAQKNLTIALGLLHDVSTAPDIWKQRRHLAPPMERAIAEVRRAKQKLGEV